MTVPISPEFLLDLLDGRTSLRKYDQFFTELSASDWFARSTAHVATVPVAIDALRRRVEGTVVGDRAAGELVERIAACFSRIRRDPFAEQMSLAVADAPVAVQSFVEVQSFDAAEPKTIIGFQGLSPNKSDHPSHSSPESPKAVADSVSSSAVSLFRNDGVVGGYKILKVLGEGGMGTVYLAEDPLIRRLVALKRMKPNYAIDSRHRQRFLREAQSAAVVEGDFIVPIYHVGEEDGVPFIAMQYLRGESLQQRLRRGPIPVDEAASIGRQIAEGLAAAHEHGLVHRDVKPSNIWLEPRGDGSPTEVLLDGSTGGVRVRILDFGLARVLREDVRLTQHGEVMGTPSFISPEQARGDPVDARADLFSFGCVLYEMTTGVRAFSGSDPLKTLHLIATHDPEPPHGRNPSVPAAFSALILHLLQ
ncbi:MAG: serine/threonine-protein kinase, partial [Planctomycetia bacterium]